MAFSTEDERVSILRGARTPDRPRVSVVIPAHGMGWLEEALESVRAQTFRDYEVIVVDDASPEPVRPRDSSDLVLIREPAAGPGGARNRGAAHARGELIAFLDSDDLWLPTKLERQIAFHERRKDLVLSSTALRSFDENATWQPKCVPPRTAQGDDVIPLARLFFENCICTSSAMLTKAAFSKTPGMAPNRFMGEDYGLWLRIALVGPIGFLDEVLVERRIHPTSLMHQTAKAGSWAEEEFGVYAEFLREHPELRSEPFVDSAFARLYFQSGYMALCRGDFGEARKSLLRSLRLEPQRAKAWVDLLRASLFLRPRTQSDAATRKRAARAQGGDQL